ncbi:hypothetical protein STXM2123_3753 [Streptomyces sp. F-3]|nr:hypothetical protein STXM2123_3753 [Streptomyces sp. F-3]
MGRLRLTRGHRTPQDSRGGDTGHGAARGTQDHAGWLEPRAVRGTDEGGGQ